ncbi:MAG: hypothetical protein FGM54_01920, partial [Chitinophagaceae bacterium]|nr:hypothetical protein [Chitinophagaceae bacterium]
GPAMQGEWALYLQFTQFSTLLLSVGLPGALIYFIASGRMSVYDGEQVSKRVLWLAGIGLLLFTLAYSFSQNRWLLPDSLLQRSTLLLIPLHSVGLLAVQCQSALLQAQNQFRKTAWIQLFGTVGYLVGSSLMYWLLPASSEMALPILLWVYTGISMGQYVWLRRLLRPKSTESITGIGFSALWQYSALAFATNLIQFLNYKMDVWILRFFECPPPDLGIYTLSVSLTQLLWLFPQALQSILFRDISNRKGIENLYRETRRWTGILISYVVLGGLAGAGLANYLVPVLFGNAYAEVANMIPFLLLGIAPFGIIMVISAYFSGTGRVYINFISAIIGFIVGIVFDVLWIPHHGIWGAAAASIASYWSTAIFVLLVFFFEKKSTRSAIQG